MKWLTPLVLLLCVSLGCTYVTTRRDNTRGSAGTYENPDDAGRVRGVGIESQDVAAMVDVMMRDILACPAFGDAETAPRVVIDAEYFKNESSSIINKSMITDLLRTELNDAAEGRIVFIGRHYSDMVERERELEEADVVSEGTRGPTGQALGYDYRLGGRIASIDSVSKSGIKTRYHQITFEMIERGTGKIVWSDTYRFRKAARDDVIYR